MLFVQKKPLRVFIHQFKKKSYTRKDTNQICGIEFTSLELKFDDNRMGKNLVTDFIEQLPMENVFYISRIQNQAIQIACI